MKRNAHPEEEEMSAATAGEFLGDGDREAGCLGYGTTLRRLNEDTLCSEQDHYITERLDCKLV